MNRCFLFFAIILFFQCHQEKGLKDLKYINIIENPVGKDSLASNEDWINKDILDDSIPGTSLDKAKKLLKSKKGKEVIIAIIDNKFDINHEALKNYIWKNPNEEINYIDDDGNGFVDDVYGWNFIGNPEGGNVLNASFEYVRYVRYYKSRFENAISKDLSNNEKTKYDLYLKAKKRLENDISKAKKRLAYSNKLHTTYIAAREALHSYFPDYNYNLEVLNQIDTIGNGLAPHVNEIREVIKWKETDQINTSVHKSYENRLHKRLNINFNERELVGDNPYDILDTIYGNNKTFNFLKDYTHGTRVASITTGVFKKLPNNFKILTISVLPQGSYHDKDLALAIKYAVNQGAKVINISFGKSFSMNKKWIFEAFKYAEKNNTLIIKSAGNDSYDLDTYETYPMDNENNGKEVSDNFLLVGASSYTANKNLRAKFSNYGKYDVDVFAPGSDIYTAYPFNKYELDSGTSLSSALTSGIAALIYSYYPNLTASQVKHIIMDSGIEYTFPVKVPTKEDKDRTIPFNQLSKSGKIVNAYNALIMADSISKKNN